MSDISGATGESLPPIETVPTSEDTPISARDAARTLSQYRWKRDAQEEKKAEAPPPAATPSEIPPAKEAEESAPPPQEETGEQQPEAIEPPAEEAPAPLDLPRSWSKDQTEVWAKLPPDTQEYLLEQDSKATRAVRQAQNEAAESRKGIEAERAALEQAKQQTEQLNAQLLERTNQSILGEFSDIRTQADVEKMAREDWPRFSLYQAKIMELQSYQRAQQETQARAQQEFRTKWDKFAKDEDGRFSEIVGDVPDQMRAGSVKMLQDSYHFSDEDLSKLWNGEVSLSLRDHRAQLLIRDAYLYRQAQKVAKQKTVKPVPTVQRPGSPAARMPEADIQDKRLNAQLDKTGSWKDAAELLLARRSARR